MYTFQSNVSDWVRRCLGTGSLLSIEERNQRFIEEALELVQAGGLPKEQVLLLVDYVYNRPEGEIQQEVGGVMVTLAALCTAQKEDMIICGKVELKRIESKMDVIRQRQEAKKKIFEKVV